MNPQLTDDAVADLPLAAARAELLEEIMSTPVVESDPPVLATTGRRRRWVAPIAAAAAVAALVGLPAWLLAGPEQARETPPAAPAPSATSAHEWVVLEAPGWEVAYVSAPDGGREVQYVKGGQHLDITLMAARYRTTYVEDRQHINHPEVDPGTPVTLLGKDALLWPYSADDHTVIGAADGRVYPEVRGSGMGRKADFCAAPAGSPGPTRPASRQPCPTRS